MGTDRGVAWFSCSQKEGIRAHSLQPSLEGKGGLGGVMVVLDLSRIVREYMSVIDIHLNIFLAVN